MTQALVGSSHLNHLGVRVRVSMTLDSRPPPPEREKERTKFSHFQNPHFGVSRSWFKSLDGRSLDEQGIQTIQTRSSSDGF